MTYKKTKATIEEYDAGNWFLFTHREKENHVSIIGSAYTEQMLKPLIEKALDTFGEYMTFTMVEL